MQFKREVTCTAEHEIALSLLLWSMVGPGLPKRATGPELLLKSKASAVGTAC